MRKEWRDQAWVVPALQVGRRARERGSRMLDAMVVPSTTVAAGLAVANIVYSYQEAEVVQRHRRFQGADQGRS